ncbi:MAG TPA: response regulator [Vicinamibacteria bacterium]|nr:response regulator [Vicinamibacteria bacterium]
MALGKTVMAIDDDMDTLELLGTVLDAAGARFLAVSDAREALDRIVEAPPDLLLVDIAMPGRDGEEIVRRLRERPAAEGGRVPAITVTACLPTESARRRWRSAGFQCAVAKPFDPRALVRLVDDLAGKPVERRLRRDRRRAGRRIEDRRTPFSGRR